MRKKPLGRRLRDLGLDSAQLFRRRERGWVWGLDLLIAGASSGRWPVVPETTVSQLPYDKQRLYALRAVIRYRSLQGRLRGFYRSREILMPKSQRKALRALGAISEGLVVAYRLKARELGEDKAC